mgnify:CR=1 FL=1
MKITTNNQWRDFVYRYDVPADILKSEFDWTTEDDMDGFFCYRGCWHHVSMFMRSCFQGASSWHGVHVDSAFSGVVLQISNDGDQYKVGTFVS